MGFADASTEGRFANLYVKAPWSFVIRFWICPSGPQTILFKISGGFVVLQEVVESMGGSVWQLAAEHATRVQKKTMSNGVLQSTNSNKEEEGSSDSEDVSISGSDDEKQTENREQQVALACEDGCVRIFAVADRQLGMLYRQSLPRIKGEILFAIFHSAMMLCGTIVKNLAFSHS
jgi:hypothetical protein